MGVLQQSSKDINLSTGTRHVGSATHVCTCPIGSATSCMYGPVCTTTYVSHMSYLGFSLQDQLRSSTTFNHILFCLSLSNMTYKKSHHIQALQQLTHVPQPYNMNATQSCIRNQHIMTIISVLNHKSVAHSINQQKPHHNNHTKNALSIHYTKSKSIHQDNNVTIP
jgi:hypothetical protein